MASMSTWTNGDLATLTHQAAVLLLTEDHDICEHCGVVPIAVNDKYCVLCLNEMLDDMAMAYGENIAVEQGWY